MIEGVTVEYEPARPTTATLRDVDRKYEILAAIGEALYFIWFAAFCLLLIVAILISPVPSREVDQNLAIASAALSASAGLGAIAAAMFFVTAQLKVAGISRRGLVELYRLRQIFPLFMSVVVGLASSVAAMAFSDKMIAFQSIATNISLASVILVLLAVVQIYLFSVVCFEPVFIARTFAKSLGHEQVAEWRLFTLRIGGDKTSCSGLRVKCDVHSNRMNFGLRDPLMPIHELVENSKNKEFGRLLSELLARIATEYRLEWTKQAPDADEWSDEIVKGHLRVVHLRDGLEDLKEAHRRLSLLLLVLHYLRRLPANNSVASIPTDVRRQHTQFLLSRFAFTLAKPNPRQHASDAETKAALTLTLYALFGVSSSFRLWPVPGRVESTRALIAVADALRDRGWHDELALVADGLDWMSKNTAHSMESHRRDLALAPQVRASRRRAMLNYPTLTAVQDPWRDIRNDQVAPDGSEDWTPPQHLRHRAFKFRLFAAKRVRD